MMQIASRWRSFTRSTRGSAVEFAFVFPFIFLMMIGSIDAGNLFSHHRKAQQLAESIVRTARALDAQLDVAAAVPLTANQITLLRHVAARMQTQVPEDTNYIWIGRFVRPPGSAPGSMPVQMLPEGLQGTANQGIVLAGDASYAAQANIDAANSIASTINAGEIVYVVDVTFSYHLMSPVPESLKRRTYIIRYAL